MIFPSQKKKKKTNALAKFFCMEVKTLIFSFSLNELNKVFTVKNFYIVKIHK